MKTLRNMQKTEDMVWFAVYDDDLLNTKFTRKINFCMDRILPPEPRPFELLDFEAYLFNANAICIRKVDRSVHRTVKAKRYLVSRQQMFDILLMKNYII